MAYKKTLTEARPVLEKQIESIFEELVKTVIVNKDKDMTVIVRQKLAKDLSDAIHEYVTSARVKTSSNGNDIVTMPLTQGIFAGTIPVTGKTPLDAKIDDQTGKLE